MTEFEKDGMRSNTVTVGLHGCRFTSSKAFLNMLREVHDMAGQHEVIAENTQQQLIADIQKTVNELKQDRKKVHALSIPKIHLWELIGAPDNLGAVSLTY